MNIVSVRAKSGKRAVVYMCNRDIECDSFYNISIELSSLLSIHPQTGDRRKWVTLRHCYSFTLVS